MSGAGSKAPPGRCSCCSAFGSPSNSSPDRKDPTPPRVVGGEGGSMDLAQAAPVAIDLESELVAIYPALYRRLTLVLRDQAEAEDVAQAAFARALESRGQFHGGDLRAWFYTIGLRLAFNELR